MMRSLSHFPLHVLLLLSTVLLSTSVCMADATTDERYAQVKASFEKNDFTGAQRQAEALLKDGHLSPQIFQLMGHIRYRQGDLGRAALWYLRASAFPPPVPEIRQNLAHIHDRTGNIRYPGHGVGDQLAALLPRSHWAHIAIASAWAIIISLVLFALRVRIPALRVLMITALLLAPATGAIAGLAWYWRPSFEKVENLAVVTSTGAKAYTAATLTAGSVVSLPPGSEVRKLEERGGWCYVEIPTEGEYRRGWVEAKILTPFWPFDRGYLE